MKKIMYVLAIFLIFPFSVFALTKEEMLQHKYSKVLEIAMPEGYRSFQGFIITDKYFVFSAIKNDESATALIVYDINTLEQLKIEAIMNGEYNFGHSNDLAYNSKTDEIYIVDKTKIHVLDGKTFVEKEPIILPIEATSIAYIADKNEFYFRYMFKGFKYNGNLEKQYEFDMPTNLTRQSFSVYDNLIYYSCHEFGEVNAVQSTYDGVLEAGSNLIYVYDLQGNLKTGIYLPEGYGEIEAMEFNTNGVPYLLFNSEEKGILYTPEYDNVLEKFSVKDETNVINAVAELATEENIIETVALKKGKYDFKPITFNEPGEYKYTITRYNEDSPEEIEMLQSGKVKNETIDVNTLVTYDTLKNKLNVTVKYSQDKFIEEKNDSYEKPSTDFSKENDNQQVIDTTINPGQSSNEVPEPGTVENPQTGAFIPIYIIPIALGIVTGVILYKRKIFFRL